MTAIKFRTLLETAIVVILVATSPVVSSQVPTPMDPDEAAINELVGTAWSGTALDGKLDVYFLDGGQVVVRDFEGEVKMRLWVIQDGKLRITFINPRGMYFLRGARTNDSISGTSTQGYSTPRGPWEVRRVAKPKPELLAATPPGRPAPLRVRAAPQEFNGVYEAEFVEEIRGTKQKVKLTVECNAAKGCTVKAGSLPPSVYERVSFLRYAEFYQARFALQYAKERRENAIQQAPELAPLLNGDAQIEACMDLRRAPRADVPDESTFGMNVLCRLDRNPWREPAVLLMGAILANCGPAFCRFGMTPVFNKTPARN